MAGLGRALIAAAVGARVTAEGPRDLLLGGLYLAGFVLAGGAAGAFWPLRRNWLGALLIGFIWAGIVGAVCGAIGVEIVGHRDARDYIIFVVGFMVVFGTVAAYQFRKVKG